MPLPFSTGTLYDLTRESKKPISERFGAGMYRPIRNTFPANNSNGQSTVGNTKGSASPNIKELQNTTGSQNTAGLGNIQGSRNAQPSGAYSSMIDENEATNEGISIESPRPEQPSASVKEEGKGEKETKTGITLNLDSDTLLQGILLSEILGKPVSKRRRGRW